MLGFSEKLLQKVASNSFTAQHMGAAPALFYALLRILTLACSLGRAHAFSIGHSLALLSFVPALPSLPAWKAG